MADVEGNYPSKGATGERGGWFRDETQPLSCFVVA
jgi:hypothetical protein